jgi:hypothetical protein
MRTSPERTRAGQRRMTHVGVARDRISATASASLWFASLFLPVFGMGSASTSDGVTLMLLGWMGPAVGDWSWFANPALLAVWILLFRDKARLSLLPFAAVLTLIFVAELFRRTITHNEGGLENEITSRRAGFYLWMASVGTAALAALLKGLRPVDKIGHLPFRR